MYDREVMFLPGNLGNTTLGDVLGRLHRQMVSGILELIEERSAVAGRRHKIHLDHGSITRVESPGAGPPIGELLVREGKITGDQHRGLLRDLRNQPGRLAGAVLVEAGLVSSQALACALAAQTKARVDGLFELRDVSLRFHAGRLVTGVKLSPSEFLHGRPRARERRCSARSGWPREARPSAQTESRSEALETLGLAEGASREQIRHAFRKLAITVHPDLHPGADKQLIESRFASLSAAYHYLIAH